MSDQPVANPPPKHRTTQAQNKCIHTPNIHALSRIRTHYPSVRESEDNSCLADTVTGVLLLYIVEKYKWDSQHNKLLKPIRTRLYSINIHLLAQVLMLHVSTFL
jgi:hypothetical protein